MAVTVLALVSAGEVAEVRWGTVARDGTARHSREGGGVVCAYGKGDAGAVFGVGHKGDLPKDSTVL